MNSYTRVWNSFKCGTVNWWTPKHNCHPSSSSARKKNFMWVSDVVMLWLFIKFWKKTLELRGSGLHDCITQHLNSPHINSYTICYLYGRNKLLIKNILITWSVHIFSSHKLIHYLLSLWEKQVVNQKYPDNLISSYILLTLAHSHSVIFIIVNQKFPVNQFNYIILRFFLWESGYREVHVQIDQRCDANMHAHVQCIEVWMLLKI